MTRDEVLEKARHGIAAWNRRDLDAVVSHDAADIDLISSLVVERLDRADTTQLNADGLCHRMIACYAP